MECNIGRADRGIRVLLGLVFIAYGVAEHTWLGAIGILPIFTAAIGWCPAYLPFGINTDK